MAFPSSALPKTLRLSVFTTIVATCAVLAAQASAQGTTSATPAATPASTGKVEQYQRKIRQAITPDEVRLACRAPNGSLTTKDEIIVCAERSDDLKNRVPSDNAARRIDPETDSPIAKADALWSAADAAPVGTIPDKAKGAFNPLALGAAIRRWLNGEEPSESPAK